MTDFAKPTTKTTTDAATIPGLARHLQSELVDTLLKKSILSGAPLDTEIKQAHNLLLQVKFI